MPTPFNDKKCLITGAASGIGRALAQQLAAQGATVFLTDINAGGLEKVAAQIRADGGRVGEARALDIANHDAVRQFAHDVHAAAGSMDIIMNVAGISVWGPIEQLRHEHWRRSVEINLMGPIHVMESFVPAMIEARRGGHLINVSSAAGLFGLPWHAAYSAAKFGLRGICEVLRFDLRRHGIHVGLVCPGGVDTGLVNTIEIVGVDRTQPKMQAMTERFRKHAVTPEQAARAILRGVRKRRYMIFTSPDVAVGYWFQRKFALPYEWVMRLLNSRLHALARPQR